MSGLFPLDNLEELTDDGLHELARRVQCEIDIREVLEREADFQVRHDHLGFYICSREEAEYEDEGNASVGFDGREHWETIEEAEAHL